MRKLALVVKGGGPKSKNGQVLQYFGGFSPYRVDSVCNDETKSGEEGYTIGRLSHVNLTTIGEESKYESPKFQNLVQMVVFWRCSDPTPLGSTVYTIKRKRRGRTHRMFTYSRQNLVMMSEAW